MIIGLTGGIGSGKSTAISALKEQGYKTISCDEITGSLYRRRKTLKKLRGVFPSAIKGRIFLKADKKEIARIVFSDKEKYGFLTEYLTNETFKIALSRAKKTKGTAIVEVPLLFENGFQKYFDKIIVITREKTERIKSVKARSALSDEEISDRLKKQIDYDSFDLTPYVVIKNDGSEKDLKAAVVKVVKSF